METISLALAGAVLLGIELTIPGFGVFGVAGILCLTASAFFLLGGGQRRPRQSWPFTPSRRC